MSTQAEAGPRTSSGLLGMLVDPGTGEPLRLSDGPEPALVGASGVRYPVRNGIPRFLDGGAADAEQGETADAFSRKWAEVSTYGHDDVSRRIQHEWYMERYGWKSEAELAAFLGSQDSILDAGCGVGRDVVWYLRHSSGIVVGVDISTAIDHARRNVPDVERLLLIQGDIARLPFPAESFDFMACDQVLHHTVNPRATLRHLVSRLKRGGHIAFYVYKVKGPVREFCDDHLREAARHMSEPEARAMSEAITEFGRALTEQQIRITIPADIPALGVKAGEFDLQRWLYWNMFKCYYNSELDWATNVMTNYDWYVPVTAYRYQPEEMRQWIAEEGLEILHEDIGDAGLSYRCRKPARQATG
jgi:ubiquinone/menaquinone biosynthesis C-methylase UbiE